LELTKVIDEILQNQNILSKKELAFLYFTKSISLDKLPEYSKQAEDSASKSVNILITQLKLNPFNADNYNCIAHIVWKKGDIEEATKYYQQALEIVILNK
jgi:tetratricopeptide (TPR) repeat protein